MTTSGVYSFTVNRDQIITMAMKLIGKLDAIEVPSADEMSDCALMLNMMIKQWQGVADFAPGLKTWMRRHGHLFLSTTTGQYTVGPNGTGWTNSYVGTTLATNAAGSQPVITVVSATGVAALDKIGIQLASGNLFWGVVSMVVGTTVTLTGNLPSAALLGGVVFVYATTAQQPVYIETCFLRDINNNDIPIKIMRSIEEYDVLPSKTNITYISDPTAIYYEFQLVNGVLYTDIGAAQDVTKHLGMSYFEAAQDFVNPTDTPSYPQEWYLPLAWGLGEQICPMFNATWTPNMDTAKKAALAVAQNKEGQTSAMYFQCDDYRI